MLIDFLERLNEYIRNLPEQKQVLSSMSPEKKNVPQAVKSTSSSLDKNQRYKAVLTGKSQRGKWRVQLIDFQNLEGSIKNTEEVPPEKKEQDEIPVRYIRNNPPLAEFEYINEENESPCNFLKTVKFSYPERYY